MIWHKQERYNLFAQIIRTLNINSIRGQQYNRAFALKSVSN